MIILKLLIILAFLLFASKSLGIIINKKTNISYETSLGLGYLSNISIFLVSIFIPMYFKMSTSAMIVFGIIYLLICALSIRYTIKNRLLFKFSRKEIIAIIIAIVFTILFALFIDFGQAEMYDSYFYSILTNSASNTKHLATINPYNGIADLQNFYKYLSFYYQSSFFSNVLFIKPAYLVLIWPFTFMTYYFLGITALGIARISNKEYINNIISIFVLTVFTTFFRAPFNALHMVNTLIPIYMLKFMFDSMKDDKNIKIYYILFVSAAACSSAILYTSVTALCAIFIASCYKKNYDKIETIFKLAIPTYILGVIYLLEKSRSLLLMLVYLGFIVLIYVIIKHKFIKSTIRAIGISLLFIIPTIFLIVPYTKNIFNYQYAFMDQGTIADKAATTTTKSCISDIVEVNNLNYKPEYNIFSTAMKYIYTNSHSLINTLLIIVTHSIFTYGGMLFFIIYGFIKHRKEHIYLTFIAYLILFFNPFVSKGLAQLTLDLNDRIYLYFNTFFAIYGIKWFFEWINTFNWSYLNKILRFIYIPYAVLLCISVISYISLLKKIDYKNFNFLYKMPNNLVESNLQIHKLISNKNNKKLKPTVLYTIKTLNLSMIDINPNNKYKLIDSKDYKSYYFDINKVNNKMLINLYFETQGNITYKEIRENTSKKFYDSFHFDNCSIKSILKNFKVDYIVMDISEKNSYKYIKNSYNIIYNKNNIILLERSN